MTGRHSRTWSDDQLEDAVSASYSWRAVLRSLGLRTTSSSAIRLVRRHAERLELDTTHFRGSRRWSDEDLASAVASAQSWAGVLRTLGLSDRSESRARVKGRAVHLGLDTGHLVRRTVPVPESGRGIGAPEGLSVRSAASAVASAWFSLRGCAVSIPLEPQPYDLLVETSGRLLRVQVKSTTYRDLRGRWQVGIGRNASPSSGEQKVPYDPDAIDTFFIVRGDGPLYLIPIETVGGCVAIDLEPYAEFVVGDIAGLMGR